VQGSAEPASVTPIVSMIVVRAAFNAFGVTCDCLKS